ncbi:hypothetical protein PR202_ga07920 [Eleusine coracana subsp. coracana]|uniref:Uncharacterized protein n=1 Tax=Eleusine coracana subsp. coracana TaxID=191504 RepID=A0AAV5C0U8_ELECO|nr:hypothetical protein PR202_ga07920 [Eleusine coracana subsp. coracana]
MRAPQERTMRDLYDRTRHKDLAAPQRKGALEDARKGQGAANWSPGWRLMLFYMFQDKSIVRKKLVSNDNIRVKAESGTCNVCCAPCSSCLHRSLAHTDSNIDCGSSQTCSTRSEIKNNSLTRTEKGFRNRGENDDEFSAASSNASYSETGGNKVVSRSSIAEDSEVDMPAKRRRLSNEGMKLSRTEYLDDNNSCVTGMPAEGKLLKKKKLSTSASSRDLTIKDRKDNSIASLNRLRKQYADESTEKNRSDVMHLSSSVIPKKLIRTQSSVSVSKGLSPKRQVHELGEAQENLSREHCEKASISNNIVEQTLDGTSNPFVDAGDNNVMLTGCSGSMKNERKARLSPKDLETDSSFSKDQIQQHAIVETNDHSKKNGVDKQEWDQDSSMDICNDGKLNRQNDVMTDCGNSEGLIDVIRRMAETPFLVELNIELVKYFDEA